MHLFLTIFIQAVFEQGPVALVFTNAGKTAMRNNYIYSALRQHYANQRNNEEKPVNRGLGDSVFEYNIWALYSSEEFRNHHPSSLQAAGAWLCGKQHWQELEPPAKVTGSRATGVWAGLGAAQGTPEQGGRSAASPHSPAAASQSGAEPNGCGSKPLVKPLDNVPQFPEGLKLSPVKEVCRKARDRVFQHQQKHFF